MTDQKVDCTGAWLDWPMSLLGALEVVYYRWVYYRYTRGSFITPTWVTTHKITFLELPAQLSGSLGPENLNVSNHCFYNRGEHPCDSWKSQELPKPCKLSFLSLVSLPPPSRKGNFNSQDKAIQHTSTWFGLNRIELTKTGKSCIAWTLHIVKWLSWLS